MWAQVVLTLGIVVAQAINIGTQHIPGYGWRISLACAGLPALVLTAGGLLLPETPNSLIERGFEEQGKQVLPGCDPALDYHLHAHVPFGIDQATPAGLSSLLLVQPKCLLSIIQDEVGGTHAH